MENLLTRFRHMGRLLLIGILLVISAAIAVYYVQQTANASRLDEEINKLRLTLVKPLASADKLRQEYEEVNRYLAPITVQEALDAIVSIAKESGIDVTPESDKLHIPPQDTVGKEKVGEGNYRVLLLSDIAVQGDYDSVMAFISNLESGEKLRTLVVKKVILSQVKVVEKDAKAGGGEQAKGSGTTKTETLATVYAAIYTKSGGTSR